MKTELTIEQSAKLIELGVSAEKASASAIHDEPCHRVYMPVFTLSDLLSILPKKIEARILNVRRTVQLEARWYGDCWLVRYSDLHNDIVDDQTEPIFVPELIDGLYKLILWCIEENHIEL